jgi:hypothetical protein
MRLLAVVVLGALGTTDSSRTNIPFSEEVIIGGQSIGKGNDLESFMFKCFTDIYNPPTSMGAIQAGEVVEVVGSNIFVTLHMRGRCEKYASYDYSVGLCDVKTKHSDTFSSNHTIQSYEVQMCSHTGQAGDSFVRSDGTHRHGTRAARAIRMAGYKADDASEAVDGLPAVPRDTLLAIRQRPL